MNLLKNLLDLIVVFFVGICGMLFGHFVIGYSYPDDVLVGFILAAWFDSKYLKY